MGNGKPSHSISFEIKSKKWVFKRNCYNNRKFKKDMVKLMNELSDEIFDGHTIGNEN